MPPFVHLHVHTQYSLLDGAIRIGDLMATVKDYGMSAVALTDHGSMFGALEFLEAAKKAGVKPIIGCEVYIAPKGLGPEGREGERNHHLVLLARNVEGYRNLMKLVSLGYTEGFYYRPRITKDQLRAHGEGLIALSACLHGEVASHLLGKNPAAAREAALTYAEILGEGNFYLEMQANGLREQALVNDALLQLGKETGLPLVATNDCHYLKRADARAHEILLCIQTGKTIQDENRMRFSTDELYFKTPDEMAKAFAHAPEAIENTCAIAARCELELKLGVPHFPVFPVPEGESVDDAFERTAWEGFGKRARAIGLRRPGFPVDGPPEYRERLAHEIAVIRKMGFPAYFLIVADFINYAKGKGIPVGPGRGSAAGSLVAYSMGITDLDPIEHGLIFERFLNVERVSLPDIDVDFCVNGREDVFHYVTEKYGRDRVAQIATFGTLQARAVIRDVGRALAMPYGEVDKVAKLIPPTLGITLKDAFQQEPRLAELQRENPQWREAFEAAFALEGLTRHASTHAAGVVIADRPIVEYTPLHKTPDTEAMTQYSMKYVEKAGLIKFDFLGLRNLTVIRDAVGLIRKNRGVTLDMLALPEGDAETFALLCRADTTGVFQLESSGMRGILTRLCPENFADIVALVALYRPGPLESGMVDSYIDGKHGLKKVTYDLEELKPILEPTYGVILYQEQVMEIARVLASYTLGEADNLRRAMGKKNPEIMAAERGRFMDGAKSNGIDTKKAGAIFDLMEKFAGYGFNKSHSAAYALIAYQTAFLKAHYAVEFMAALLNSFLSSTDQVVKLIAECRGRGIEVLPPDVNASEKDFTVVEGKIRFGLGAVKGVGDMAVEAIMSSREKGPFASLFDLCERVDSQKVNRRVIEQLIKCGAFDTLHEGRSRVLAGLDAALDRAQALQREADSRQMNLFAQLRAKKPAPPPALPEAPPWDSRTTLQFEKESLGFYISGHPLDLHAESLSALCTATTESVREKRDGTEAVLCGLLTVTKVVTTKKGEQMGFLALEDKAGVLEVVVFPEPFALARPLLEGDEPRVVVGKVQHDEKGPKFLANAVMTIEDAQVQSVESVRVRLSAEALSEDDIPRLRHLLMNHPGSTPVVLHLAVDGDSEAVIALSEKLAIAPSGAFFQDMTHAFGPRCCEAVHKFPSVGDGRKNGNGHGNGRRRG